MTPYEVIATPFLDEYLVLLPGCEEAMRIPAGHYEELRLLAEADGPVPGWLIGAVEKCWHLLLRPGPMNGVVAVRESSDLGFGRASWELNLGCNYECEHCYLDTKRFEGLDWEGRLSLLHTLRDAGVVWLQMTGGEPLIDKMFVDSYCHAWDLGMMISVSTNASRLWRDEVIDTLTRRPPYHVTISVYGATADSYDALVKRRGAFDKFRRGIAAGIAAGLPMNLNLVITKTNADELEDMVALAKEWGLPHHVFSNMSPTIEASPRSLPTQSVQHIKARRPFQGCNAGHTFFHVDPFGMATTCKVAREHPIDLIAEGVDGLRRLGGIADSLLARGGGCSGCSVQGTCGTCMPLVRLYRGANASLDRYCQHRETGEVIINREHDNAAAPTGAGTRFSDAAA